jgi:hypothetical protein
MRDAYWVDTSCGANIDTKRRKCKVIYVIAEELFT